MSGSIKLTDDRLVAVVYLTRPKGGDGDSISIASIVKALQEAKFKHELSLSAVKEAVLNFKKSDAPEKNIRLYSDALVTASRYFKVSISEDEMDAYMKVNLPPTRKNRIELPVIQRILKLAGVTSCYLEEVITELINGCNNSSGNATEHYHVAFGKPEIMAQDASFELNASFRNKDKVSRVVKKGPKKITRTYSALISDTVLEAGAVLLTKTQPQKGEAGLSVTGKRLWSSSNRKTVQSRVVAASKNVDSRADRGKVVYFSLVRGIGCYIGDRILEVEEIFDGSFELRTSKDKLSLLIDLQAPYKGKKIEIPEISDEIEKMGIKAPVNMELIENSVAIANTGREKIIKDLLVASGVEPTHGLDGQVAWNLSFRVLRKPRVLKNGMIDYKGDGRHPFVRVGEVAGKWLPETKAGLPGTDVFGVDLSPSDGRQITLDFKECFDFEDSAEGTREIKLLRVKVPGFLQIKKKEVHIDPVFETDEINYSTGNIDFDGNVVVKGTVADNFFVKCTKDIYINGNVGACRIESGGDVIIKGGMNGKRQGAIKAAGNIFIKYAENCSLNSNKSIYVMGHSVISTIVAREEIHIGLNRTKGRVIGGNLYAWSLIRTSLIGSEHSAQDCRLWVGIDKNLADESECMKRRIEALQMEIGTFQAKLKGPETLDPMVRDSLEKATASQTEELNELLQNYQETVDRIYSKEGGMVEVLAAAQAHTEISIGQETKVLTNTLEKTRLKLVDGRILLEKIGQ